MASTFANYIPKNGIMHENETELQKLRAFGSWAVTTYFNDFEKLKKNLSTYVFCKIKCSRHEGLSIDDWTQCKENAVELFTMTFQHVDIEKN